MDADLALLHKHLQSAIELELWTIPLYLTAAYSIKMDSAGTVPVPTLASHVQNPSLTAEQEAFNHLYTVFVQEMLHLELACNLASALGHAPDLTSSPPQWNAKTGIPHVNDPAPPDGPFTVKLGILDENQANLFLAVELPGEDAPNHGQPKDPRDYETIGEFYAALRQLVSEHWDDAYVPDSAQKSGFSSEYHGFSITISGESAAAKQAALSAIDAIVSQGEGASADGSVPAEYRPDAEPETGAPPDDAPVTNAEDQSSHYWRFTRLKALVQGGLSTYAGGSASAATATAQSNLDVAYSGFLNTIQAAYEDKSAATIPLDAMWSISDKIVAVFQAGGTPSFTYMAAQPQLVLEMHACQGLNSCQGHGWQGSGTMPGDGDCATAVEHTCGGGNSCRGQGGCGYPEGPVHYVPNENACKGAGGCGAPIPAGKAGQVFHDGPDKGKSVWDRARDLFEKRMAAVGHAVAERPAPNDRRSALDPT